MRELTRNCVACDEKIHVQHLASVIELARMLLTVYVYVCDIYIYIYIMMRICHGQCLALQSYYMHTVRVHGVMHMVCI